MGPYVPLTVTLRIRLLYLSAMYTLPILDMGILVYGCQQYYH